MSSLGRERYFDVGVIGHWQATSYALLQHGCLGLSLSTGQGFVVDRPTRRRAGLAAAADAARYEDYG